MKIKKGNGGYRNENNMKLKKGILIINVNTNALD